MKICLIGGTFDPPHWGHALLAETLRTARNIRTIVFLPAYIPPHKRDDTISDADHRIAMLQRFVRTNQHFQLDTREIRRQGISYTIDTIRDLKKEQALNAGDIGFLIGADNYLELNSWKDADALVRECTILVMPRPGYPLDEATDYRGEVEFVRLPRIEISSSGIRERARQGVSIRYYVTEAVEQYIHEHQLYGG